MAAIDQICLVIVTLGKIILSDILFIYFITQILLVPFIQKFLKVIG